MNLRVSRSFTLSCLHIDRKKDVQNVEEVVTWLRDADEAKRKRGRGRSKLGNNISKEVKNDTSLDRLVVLCRIND